MTYIDRFSSGAGAENLYRQLGLAREQAQHSFRDDERREIPQVLAVFEALEAVMSATRDLRRIFEGSGTHTVADFMPDESGLSVNDRQMEERRKSAGMY